MGSRNARMQRPGLEYYGTGYDPYTGYGGMENYGSFYGPTGGDPYGYGITDGPFITSLKAPLGGLGGYPGGFNALSPFGQGVPKVRQIFVPNNVVGAFQNLLQQGCGGMQMTPQLPYAPPPMMPQMPCAPPPMMPQMPCAPPPMMAPPMMPQMPCAPPPMMPQMPQMGSNCCSMSIQLPSVAPQMSFAPQAMRKIFSKT